MPALQAPARSTTMITPADPAWDDARKAWNLAVDQNPAAVVLPTSAAQAAAAGHYARHRGGGRAQGVESRGGPDPRRGRAPSVGGAGRRRGPLRPRPRPAGRGSG